MNDSQSYQEFQDYIKLQHTKVRSNTEVVSAADLGQDWMLHLDKSTPPAFVPRIGTSFSDDEDRTLPRVTVSDSVLGCIIGYYRFIDDFLSVNEDDNNGYYINMLPFEYCLKPNAKLVPYAEHANEHWLLGYNKETLKYKPRTVGKLFISEMGLKRNDKSKQHLIRCTFFIEINEDVSILFSKNKQLTKGYYRVTGDLTDYNSNNDANDAESIEHTDLDLFTVTRVDIKDYRQVKRLSASLLDASSTSLPVYTQW